MTNSSSETESEQRAALVEWLNSINCNLNLPIKASDEELRASLIDGSVLCKILNRVNPGSLNEEGYPENSSVLWSENVKRFLTAMDELRLPRFEASDLEKGSMKNVINCLLLLKAQTSPSRRKLPTINTTNTKPSSTNGDASSRSPLTPLSGEERRKTSLESKFQRPLQSPILPEIPYATLHHHVGHKFHEVFQMKQGRYADLPATKLSEMMKSNSLDNAPTQSLLSVMNGILDESVERKNSEIPHRVACLLRKVVQEIERRISTQAEHLRTQNNLFKVREEKYQSRIRVLEALASGACEETKHLPNQLQQIKVRRTLDCSSSPTSQADSLKGQEKPNINEQEIVKLVNDIDKNNNEILALKKELQIAKKMHQQHYSEMESELELAKKMHKQHYTEMESEANDGKTELQVKLKEMESEAKDAKAELQMKLKEMESDAKDAKAELQMRLKEVESLLADSNNKVKELEAISESKAQSWRMKENVYNKFMDFQNGAVRELRNSSQSIKQEILKTEKIYFEEFNNLEVKLKVLVNAAENYHEVLAENRKLFNEIQDLKGNIRVYCRIRPFLPGQPGKQTIIESTGENGQLIVANPSRTGKEGQRSFKFNKVFGPTSTQGDVFTDIQPFVQSVVDGYNVCIFAYGQTGSGKTYTMTGPNGAKEEEWGVNYRALNNLFKISQSRKSSILYEVGVQMVEIYNEQIRDLLSRGSQKKLGVTSISQANGLAVPDATMKSVSSTSDVLDFMNIGLKNRAVSSTALNERSSRSHSIVTIHVRGKDLKVGSSLYGNLHLVDLAGSERVDRSEVTGDRLREAQHINKSLSSLGDVIFALAQKSNHVPYRNSKLTHVLQSSLGGQAKTLMFVQLNPDATSYSESMSTLKFAERVSGVELGAARSSKEGKDVKELLDQMASLKDTIGKKDEEIERLQLLKDLKNGYPGINNEQHEMDSVSDKHFEADSQLSTDEEKCSEISDAPLAVGTENEDAAESISPNEGLKLGRTKVASRIRLLQKSVQALPAAKTDNATSKASKTSTTSKASPTTIKKSLSSKSLNLNSVKPTTKRWH